MILVTGATGTVGREVLCQLLAAGVPSRALVREVSKTSCLPAGTTDVATADFADPATLDRALRGADHVFLASYDGPDQLALQTNLIDAARHAGTEHIVRLSVVDADPFSDMIIRRWNGAAEKRLEASGLVFTHLRPNWFMQNFPDYVAKGVIDRPVGDGRASFVDVRDIAAVAVKALTGPGHSGKTHTLTGPDALDHREVAAELTVATGRTVVFEDVPREKFRWAAKELGRPGWFADMMVELFDNLRAGKVARVTDTVERVTGRPPRSFGEFARDLAAGHLAHA